MGTLYDTVVEKTVEKLFHVLWQKNVADWKQVQYKYLI